MLGSPVIVSCSCVFGPPVLELGSPVLGSPVPESPVLASPIPGSWGFSIKAQLELPIRVLAKLYLSFWSRCWHINFCVS